MIKFLKKYKELLLLIIILVGLFIFFYKEFNRGSEFVGDWYLVSAEKNGEDIDLKEIFGTAIIDYGGTLSLNSDGTYTEFIGVYSEEETSSLEGTYHIKKNIVYLTNKNGVTKNLSIINQDNKLLIKEDIGDGVVIYFSLNDSKVSNANQESNGVNEVLLKYVGDWVDEDNLNSLRIDSVSKDEILFSVSFYRVASYDDIKASFVSDDEVEFSIDNDLSGTIKFDNNIYMTITKSSIDDIKVGTSYEFYTN